MTLSGFAAVMARETNFETVGADQLVESAADLARTVLSMIRGKSACSTGPAENTRQQPVRSETLSERGQAL
jgi:hypothetical protein